MNNKKVIKIIIGFILIILTCVNLYYTIGIIRYKNTIAYYFSEGVNNYNLDSVFNDTMIGIKNGEYEKECKDKGGQFNPVEYDDKTKSLSIGVCHNIKMLIIYNNSISTGTLVHLRWSN